MASNLDPAKVEAIIRDVAAKHIMPYHKALEDAHISHKSGNKHNLVTVADHESEEALIKALTELLPGSVIVGEESYEEDKSILDLLDDPENVVWVIDPVDGTGNFAAGRDTFAVMVALVVGGETKMGWVYDPVGNRMGFAEKGKGAYLNGQPLKINPDSPEAAERGYAWYTYQSGVRDRLPEDKKDMALGTLRCTGHEYLNIASGKASFGIYNFMNPWDHLAGTLLVAEAGGYVRKWDGSLYNPEDGRGGIIAANSPETWQLVRDAIPKKSLLKQGIEP